MTDTLYPWQALSIPDWISDIPAMLADEERQYLAWLTLEEFRGRGAIVELGPWVGASSCCLAHGLAERGLETQIQSFDLFVWDPTYMERPHPVLAGLTSGEDFQPAFHTITRPYAKWLAAHKMNLAEPHWDGGAIEILFVDAAKSWDLTSSILSEFGPHLEPGESRVVLQDYRIPGAVWLPLLFDTAPELWQYQESVEDGSTVTFTPKRRLSRRETAMERRLQDFSYSDALRVWSPHLDNTKNGPTRNRYASGLMRLAIAFDEPEEVERLRHLLQVEAGERNADRWVDSAFKFASWDLRSEARKAIAAKDVERVRSVLRRLERWYPEHVDTATCKAYLAQHAVEVAARIVRTEQPPRDTGTGGAQPAGLASFKTLELASEILNRIEHDPPSAAQHFHVLGRLAAELASKTQHPANRFWQGRSTNLLGRLGQHPDFDPDRIPGAVIVEIGCGALNPLAGLFLLVLMGAKKCIGIDVEAVASIRPAVRALYSCAADVLTGVVSAEVPIDLDLARSQLAGFDLRKLAAGEPTGVDGDRLEFRCASAEATGLEAREVDTLTSDSLLQHVADVEAVLGELARIAKPGAIGVHAIDGYDQRHWSNPEVHPLHFLRDGSEERIVHNCNRIRPMQFREKFERHGFEVVAVHIPEQRRVPIDEELRQSFVEPFRSLPTDVLEVGAAVFCVRRR